MDQFQQKYNFMTALSNAVALFLSCCICRLSSSASTSGASVLSPSGLSSPLAAVSMATDKLGSVGSVGDRPLLEMPPSIPRSLQDLLQSQWELGKDFLLGQTAQLDGELVLFGRLRLQDALRGCDIESYQL